ncbi:DUF5713 family protein [Streptomyces sp. NPDC002920]
MTKRQIPTRHYEFNLSTREWIAEDFWFVASAYRFTDADVEELIAGRDW